MNNILECMTVASLKVMLRNNKVRGYSKLKKGELITLIKQRGIHNEKPTIEQKTKCMSVKHLKAILRANKVSGYSRLKKPELIKLIKERGLEITVDDVKKSKIKVKRAEPIAKPEVKRAEPIAKPEVKRAEPIAKPEVKRAEPIAKPEVKRAEPIAKPEVKRAEPLNLQPHQKIFVKHFIDGKTRGALAIHGVGTGKTLTAVVSAQLYLKIKPNNKIVIITPASLLDNFKKELYRYDSSAENDKRYKFFTYDSWGIELKKKNPDANCVNSLLIIDEAQNLRTPIKISTDNKVKSGRKVYDILKHCAMEADKVLLLSATPIINSPEDINNLMAMINGTLPIGVKGSKSKFKSMDKLMEDPDAMAEYFGCKLSFFMHGEESKKRFFPAVQEYVVPIPMTAKSLVKYTKIEKTEERSHKAFWNKLRRESNMSEDLEKVNFTANWTDHVVRGVANPSIGLTQSMIDSHTNKVVIFTHFKEAGSNLVIKALNDKKIAYSLIDGTVSRAKRQSIVDNYVSGKVKVILISKAGAEGLNLLETGYIILLEPSWNDSEIEQVKGRGIRFMSHARLPLKKRNVQVMQLFLVKPRDVGSELNNMSEVILPSGDFKDHNIINSEAFKRKVILMGKIVDAPYNSAKEWKKELALLRTTSIEHGRSPEEQIQLLWHEPSIDISIAHDSFKKQRVINKFLSILESSESMEKCGFEERIKNKVNASDAVMTLPFDFDIGNEELIIYDML
jgi:superfamily II DNA or RNA helicase